MSVKTTLQSIKTSNLIGWAVALVAIVLCAVLLINDNKSPEPQGPPKPTTTTTREVEKFHIKGAFADRILAELRKDDIKPGYIEEDWTVGVVLDATSSIRVMVPDDVVILEHGYECSLTGIVDDGDIIQFDNRDDDFIICGDELKVMSIDEN